MQSIGQLCVLLGITIGVERTRHKHKFLKLFLFCELL